MKVVLKEYLDVLRAKEILSPNGNPDKVPNLSELADATGLARQTLSRLANNQNRHIPVDVINVIMEELRGRGFGTELKDVMVYEGGKLAPAGENAG